MGMSSSQVRLLSLTARMHDVEFEAQAIQNAKLQLANDSDQVYEAYVSALEDTKYQMEIFTGTDFQFQDVTYQAMINTSANNAHDMFVLTDARTNEVFLPSQIVDNLPVGPAKDEFLGVVATEYLGYTSVTDMSPTEQNYWTSVFYQVFGYAKNGQYMPGYGYKAVPAGSMTDGEWLQKMVENAHAVLNKLTPLKETETGGESFNIFANTSVTTDTSLKEVSDDVALRLAEAKYESDNRKINQKDKQFDLKLTKLETERNALKTEYDSVKKVISDNVERSYKTFNA